MSDIYIAGYPEGQPPQKTDVHYRSEDGKGMFNWRMVFPLTLPCKFPRLKIQLWDKDLLNPNDVISEATLDLRGFYKRAYKGVRDASGSNVRYGIDTQYVAMGHPNYNGVQGRCEMSVELLTDEEAKKRPVGLGRDAPNVDPFLAEPDRPKTSFGPFSPFSYLKYVGWAQHKWKVIGACGCCFLLFIVLPIVVTIAKFFG